MNFFKLLVLIFTFINVSVLQGQNLIKGRILDSESGTFLPYANLVYKYIPKGSASNSEGEFQLAVDDGDIGDTLIISYVGYASKRIAIRDILNKKDVVIKLEPATIFLDDITIKSELLLDDPLKIVRKAIERIPFNCASQPFVLKGFYRQVHREDDVYKRLIEAAVVVQDNGFNESNAGNKIDVPELRKSFDLREMRNENIWSLVEGKKEITREDLSMSDGAKQSAEDIRRREAKFVTLRSFFLNDLIRSFKLENDDEHFSFLNADFIKEHKFKLDTITAVDDDVLYVIKILPSAKSQEYMYRPNSQLLPVGKLYIRSSDFAIVQMDYSYILNPRKKNTLDYRVWMRTHGSGIAFSNSIRYSEFNGKMYLSSLRTFQYDPMAYGGQIEKTRASDYTKGYFYLDRLFITTEIVTDPNKVTRMSQEKAWNDNIYSKDLKYNESFWKEYTILEETKYEKKLLDDLQKNGQLDEQFRKSN